MPRGSVWPRCCCPATTSCCWMSPPTIWIWTDWTVSSDFVAQLRAGMMVVSHDREFLARCVSTLVELDLAQQWVAVYRGGYQAYLAERELARQHAREAYQEFAERRAELQQRARTQRGWTEKGL